MTQVLSGLFKIEIVSAGGNALQSAALALSANQWGTLNIGNQMNIDAGGTGDGSLSYSHRLMWNPIAKEVTHYGGCHGNSGTLQRLWLGRYRTSTNTWNPNNPPIAIGAPSGNPTHAFGAFCIDTQTGDSYCLRSYEDTDKVYRYRPSTGTVDTPLPNKPGRLAQSAVLVYHPNLYGGQGGLLYCNDGGIYSINLRNIAGGWTVVVDRNNQVDAMGSGGFGTGCYSTKDDAAYMGGGGGIALWKVAASAGAGSGSQIAQAPAPTYIWDPSNAVLEVFDSGNSAHGMVGIHRDGAIYGYTVGTNSWASIGISVPAGLLAIGGSNIWRAFCAIPEYGCIVAIAGQNGGSFAVSTATPMYILKY